MLVHMPPRTFAGVGVGYTQLDQLRTIFVSHLHHEGKWTTTGKGGPQTTHLVQVLSKLGQEMSLMLITQVNMKSIGD